MKTPSKEQSLAAAATVAIGLMLTGLGCRSTPDFSDIDAAQLPVPIYVCPRTKQPPVIDGDIDDPVWESVTPMGDFTCFGNRKGRPALRTTTRMCWDDQNLYVAFACLDIDVWSQCTARDATLLEEEAVEINVDTGGDGKLYRTIQINPRNAVTDLSTTASCDDNTTQISREENAEWNAANLRSAVAIKGTLTDRTDRDLGWTVEMAIPLANFADSAVVPPRPGDRWRMQFMRIDRSPALGAPELSAWSPTDTHDNTDRFGTVVFGWFPETPHKK